MMKMTVLYHSVTGNTKTMAQVIAEGMMTVAGVEAKAFPIENWDAAWVKESTTKQVENGQQGYGYLFWGGPQGTFRADGKYGQLSILCRDKDAVITVVAECRDVPSLMDAIFDELYPQL